MEQKLENVYVKINLIFNKINEIEKRINNLESKLDILDLETNNMINFKCPNNNLLYSVDQTSESIDIKGYNTEYYKLNDIPNNISYIIITKNENNIFMPISNDKCKNKNNSNIMRINITIDNFIIKDCSSVYDILFKYTKLCPFMNGRISEGKYNSCIVINNLDDRNKILVDICNILNGYKKSLKETDFFQNELEKLCHNLSFKHYIIDIIDYKQLIITKFNYRCIKKIIKKFYADKEQMIRVKYDLIKNGSENIYENNNIIIFARYDWLNEINKNFLNKDEKIKLSNQIISIINSSQK